MPLMWDNVTEIKCNTFGRVWLLNTENKQMRTYSIYLPTLFFRKELFFFECLYLNEYDIRMLLQIYNLTSDSSNLKAQHKFLC